MVIQMIALDLFDYDDRQWYPAPEADALCEPGALQEAALIDMRFDATASSLGLMFDLRGAIQIRDATVAILIARSVRGFEWMGLHGRSGRIWHAVTGSIPDRSDSQFSLLLGFAPDAELRLTARGAHFFVGDMPGMEGPPPDFVASSAKDLRRGLPSWTSAFTPIGAAFFDADGPSLTN